MNVIHSRNIGAHCGTLGAHNCRYATAGKLCHVPAHPPNTAHLAYTAKHVIICLHAPAIIRYRKMYFRRAEKYERDERDDRADACA